MKRKFLSLALIITVLSSLLAACSTNSGSNGNTNNGAVIAPKLSIAIGTDGLQYVEASADINKDKYVLELEKASSYDLDLELIPHSDFNQKITLLFAGGDLPDLLQTNGVNTQEIAPALNMNILTPLNDLIDQYAPNLKANVPQEVWDSEAISKDGVIYAIPKINPTPNMYLMMLRKDWLDHVGLKVPTTTDEYVEMLRAFKNGDPNKNNTADEIPFTGRENLAFTEAFFGAYDVIPYDWRYIDGELIPNMIRPEMKEALALYRLLFEEKLLDNEVFVQKGKDWDAKIKGQSIAGLWTHTAPLFDKWVAEVGANNPDAEIIPIAHPVGPDGKGGGTIGSPVLKAWVIPQSNKNPEVALQFLDWFYSEEAQTLLNYGIEEDNYTVENGEIKYNYPTDQQSLYEEEMHLAFLRFVGPSYLTDEDYMFKRPGGAGILQAIEIANNEGRINDGLSMPIMPKVQAQPELLYTGLWLEAAAKIITGKEPIDYFDTFVEDWMNRGGDQFIQEATEWYNSK